MAQSSKPEFFWRAIFKDLDDRLFTSFGRERDPGDLSPRPKGFARRPIGIEERRYLCSAKVTRENEAENQRLWRELVLRHGPGTYNFYDTHDEDGEKPVPGSFWKVIFIDEEDVEAFQLKVGDEPLSDARLNELELALDGDVARGDARSAELVALEYENRGRYVEARLAARAGMKAPEQDPGIWVDYLEEKKSERNVQRRLLKILNRSARAATPRGFDGTTYLIVDCGEASPDVVCEKCGKKGAFASDYAVGSVKLCYGCRRLPRAEWPEPKPKPNYPFFQNFQSFQRGES